MDVPLYKELTDRGWMLWSHGGSRRSAEYYHPGIPGVQLCVFLDEQGKPNGRIVAVTGMAKIEIGPFSPVMTHPAVPGWILLVQNLHAFGDEIAKIKPAKSLEEWVIT